MDKSETRPTYRDPDATFAVDATFFREEALEGFRSFFAPYARLYAILTERAAVFPRNDSSGQT